MRKLLALVACCAVVTVPIALADEGNSTRTTKSTTVPQPDPCEGHVAEFADLAQRAWHPRRWDWWTSHPPTKKDMQQLADLRPCTAVANTRSRTKEIWAGQRRQFGRAWIGRLGGSWVVGWLRSTRSCESGGSYRIATGNGFYGAYQFMPSTWYSVGGRGMPHQAPPREQDYRAAYLMRTGGTGHWPVCG